MSTALAAARAKTRGKRMLRNALEGYGEDELTLSEWNAKKAAAVAGGKWTWKAAVVDANQAIKSRLEKEGADEAMKDRIVDISSAMEAEIHGDNAPTAGKTAPVGSVGLTQPQSASDGCCNWR